MKNYEGMFLVDSREYKKGSESVEDQINALIEKCNGKVVRSEKWDDRKLAFEIKGASNGTYYLYYFTGESTTISMLNRECELSPLVLRVLVLRIKSIPDPVERAEPQETEAAGSEWKPAPAEYNDEDSNDVGGNDSYNVEDTEKARATEASVDSSEPDQSDDAPAPVLEEEAAASPEETEEEKSE